MVEFALILIPLLLVLFAIIDFGRFFWTDHVVTEAAREGARMAILNEPSNGEVRGIIGQTLAKGGITAAANVSISARVPGRPVNVTVTVPFEFLLLPGFVAGATGINSVSSTAVMVHEP